LEPKKGFFDKINNAFFSVIDVFLQTLEERGWNIPEETRFLYHTAIFIFVFWLGFPLILQYFLEFEALVLLLAIASFCIANMMPIRKLLGYYSSEEKVHNIVNRIKNNQISIKQVRDHLHKNLLPPHLSLSIIRAYQAKGQGLPPEIIRSIIRQPQEVTVFKELLKEELNESDFSLLMRKYRNRIPKQLLLQTADSQKMNWLTVKDLLFYQENAYQAINEIGKKADDAEIMDFVIAEKHRYKQKMMSKNFLRNHHLSLSLSIATLAASPAILLLSGPFLQPAGFALAWLLVFETLYNYGIRAIYFRL
jgi:hypothetical protein